MRELKHKNRDNSVGMRRFPGREVEESRLPEFDKISDEETRKEIIEEDKKIQDKIEEAIREKLSPEAIKDAEKEALIENDIREAEAPTKEEEKMEEEQKEKTILDIGNHLNWLEERAGKECIKLSRIEGVSKPELYKAQTEWEEVSSATENFFADEDKKSKKDLEVLKISPTEFQLLEVLKTYPTEIELKAKYLWGITIKIEEDIEESRLSALVGEDGEKENTSKEKLRELSRFQILIAIIDKKLKKEKKQWIDVLRKTPREERKIIFSKIGESKELIGESKGLMGEPITENYAALEKIESQMSKIFKEEF